MIYKDFQGEKLSALGLGAMRLPVRNGDDGAPDQEAVNEMVACAMAGGQLLRHRLGLPQRPV